MEIPQYSSMTAPPPRLRRHARSVALVVAMCSAAACATGVTGESADGDTEGPSLLVDGKLWCAETAGAYGWDSSNSTHELIEQGTPAAPAVFCECLSEQVAGSLDDLVALSSNNWDLDNDGDDDIDVTVSGGVTFIRIGDEASTEGYSEAFNVRNIIINEAEDLCEVMRDDLNLVDTTNPTTFPGCGEVADNTDDPDGTDPGPDVLALYEAEEPDCAATDQLEIDTGGYSGRYTIANVITYNTSSSTYEIDEDFFEDMIANPDWWLEDDSIVVSSVGGGYELDRVQTTDIVYVLGLRDGDKFVSIGSMDLDTVDDAVAAMETLRDDTTFSLTVKRNGNTVTLDYEKVQ